MMSLFIGVVPLAVGAFALTAGIRAFRARVRARATRVGVPILREARDLPARVNVETSVIGGPVATDLNRGRADLVLTGDRLLLATHHGRILQIDRTHPGRATCTGPMRLVIEGQHPSGITRVRVELVCDAAEIWAADIRALGPTSSKA